MSIGENIKRVRKDKGLTQAELGEKLNVTASMIGAWEKGVRNPKLSTIRKIAIALDLSLMEIVGENWDFFGNEEFTIDWNNADIARLLFHYDKLNTTGKKEAEKRLEELTFVPTYKEEPKDPD